ncbi:MAG: pyridoxal 5'-phosphate synthase glutaminase subunit PdxT [Blastocatellia bacterium]|nr:pyridoxal 5'-phosphate synthase glutaminase subunit PdxT [Blastocatellia bacterium]
MMIGVMALQGGFAKHCETLSKLGTNWCEVRAKEDLKKIDGLIIPGGESTTMLKLLKDEGMFEPLKEFTSSHPTFGTCAGLILMAKRVENPSQDSLGLLDITAGRNAYGRQVDSFNQLVNIPIFNTEPFELIFIRAPQILETGSNVTVLARCQDKPVLIQQGFWLGATFHPELTNDTRIHQLFLSIVNQRRSVAA